MIFCFNDTNFVEADTLEEAKKIYAGYWYEFGDPEEEVNYGNINTFENIDNEIRSVMKCMSIYHGYTLFCGPGKWDFATKVEDSMHSRNKTDTSYYIKFGKLFPGHEVYAFLLDMHINNPDIETAPSELACLDNEGKISFRRVSQEMNKLFRLGDSLSGSELS